MDEYVRHVQEALMMLRADRLTPEVIVISPRFQQYLEGVGASVPAPSDEEMQLFGVPIRVSPGISTHYIVVSKTRRFPGLTESFCD